MNHYKLKERRLELGLLLSDVAKEVGISESTLSRWESGNIANMRRDKIEKYARVLRVNPLWIMGMDVPMEKQTYSEIYKKADFIEIKQFATIPVLGSIRAGTPIPVEQNIEAYRSAVLPTGDIQNYFYLRVSGNSMIGANIHEGYLVLVYKTLDIKSGDIVVAGLNGDEATVKRYKEAGPIKYLQAANPEYPDIILDEKKEPYIIGKVVKVEFDV